MRKVLVIDDSALMRRIVTDILKSDGRFEVKDTARDGKEALALLESNKYDVLILDINMPNMNGIEFMEELRRRNIKENIIVSSTDTAEGAAITIKALELGAFDFIQKPKNTLDARVGAFKDRFISLLVAATDSMYKEVSVVKKHPISSEPVQNVTKQPKSDGKKRLVAIASSTGGPNALQQVIPYLPKNLAAPVLVVQHMPAGYTASLAERLDSMCKLNVVEAAENDVVENGKVFLAKGGSHMKYNQRNKFGYLYYTDEPAREGVRPSANYMYESLMESDYDEIVCVVMTGMGQDGTIGIKNLKAKKNLFVISQSEESCVVYGMPKAIDRNNLSDKSVELHSIASEIVSRVGIV